MMIKKIILALLVVSVVGLAGCGDDSGSSSSTLKYRTCTITSASGSWSSGASMINENQAKAQCWVLPTGGYSDRQKALDWCTERAKTWLTGRGFSGTYGVQVSSSSSCN